MTHPSLRPAFPLLAFLAAAVAGIGGPGLAAEQPGADAGSDRPTPRAAPTANRASLSARRDAALASGEVAEAARLNGELAAEAIQRSIAIHDAWMTRRDPETGLFPQSLHRQEWTYRNVAADFFCFQWAIALTIGADSLPALRQTFERERALNVPGGLCDTLEWRTGKQVGRPVRDRMFSTSEYLKDGLIGFYERWGDPAVLARIQELADAMMAAADQPSKFGPLPSYDSEVNGNVLQAFSRLTFAAADERYGEFAGRLADAVVEQMLANTSGVPVKRFDYRRNTYARGLVHLRDHGNETAVGLSEAFAMAVAKRESDAWNDRAHRWAGPLARMYELILTRGVNAQGLLVDQLRDGTLEPRLPDPCDNWGYLLMGATLFTEAAERLNQAGGTPVIEPSRLDAIMASVDRIALAVTKTDGLRWEGDHHDGFADSIESAIYIAWKRPHLRDRMLAWADSQMAHMFACQRPDGFVSDDYLDGNFIRTALLYAEARSAGFRLEPWDADTTIGASTSEDGSTTLTIAAGSRSYAGRLVADHPRHREHLRLPWNWARINGWPEWTAAGTTFSDNTKTMPVRLEPGERLVLTIGPDGRVAHPTSAAGVP